MTTWTLQRIVADAARFPTRHDWFLHSQSAYRISKREGWFTEATAHMPRRERKLDRKNRLFSLKKKPRLQKNSSQTGITPSISTSGKCHQRVRRDETLQEDTARLTPVLGDLSMLRARDFDLRQVHFTHEHRGFIQRYEWLGNAGFGIKWCFEARFKGELGGVILVSEPYHPGPADALIQRGACASWTPKNLGSRMVMFACEWMARNTEKRRFYAYGDSEASEVGQIYQACNFTYLGSKRAKYGVNEHGERRSLQSFKRTHAMVPWLATQGIVLPPTCFTSKGYLRWSQIPLDTKRAMRVEVKRRASGLSTRELIRHRYCLILGADRHETKKLRQAAGWTSLPYPKRRLCDADDVLASLVASASPPVLLADFA